MARNPIIDRALKKGFKSGGTIGDIGGGTGARVTSAGGGTGGSARVASGGGTGGTQIVVDVNTGKSAIVRQTPENLAAIERGRQAAAMQRQGSSTQPTTRQEFQARLLKQQGYNVVLDKSGSVTAVKGDRKLVISREGRSVNVPKSAKVNTVVLSTVKAQRDRFLERKKQVSKQGMTKAELKAALRGEVFLRTPQKAAMDYIIAGKKGKETTSIRKVTDSFISTINKRREEAERVSRQLTQKEASGGKLTSNERRALALAGLQNVGIEAIATPGTLLVAATRPKETTRAILEAVKGKDLDEVINGIIKSTAQQIRGNPAGFIAGTVGTNALLKGVGNIISKTVNVSGRGVNIKLKGTKGSARGSVRVTETGVKSSATVVNKAGKTIASKSKTSSSIINRIKSAMKKRAEAKGSRINLAREIIRKQEANKAAIRQLKKVKADTARTLRKSGASRSVKRSSLRSINARIRNIRKSNRLLERRLSKTRVSPGRRTVLRRNINRLSKPSKLKTKVSVSLKPSLRVVAQRFRVSISKRLKPVRRAYGKSLKNMASGLRATNNKIMSLLKASGGKITPSIRSLHRLAKNIAQVTGRKVKVGKDGLVYLIQRGRGKLFVTGKVIQRGIGKKTFVAGKVAKKIRILVARLNLNLRVAGIKIVLKYRTITAVAVRQINRFISMIKSRISRGISISRAVLDKISPVSIKIVRTRQPRFINRVLSSQEIKELTRGKLSDFTVRNLFSNPRNLSALQLARLVRKGAVNINKLPRNLANRVRKQFRKSTLKAIEGKAGAATRKAIGMARKASGVKTARQNMIANAQKLEARRLLADLINYERLTRHITKVVKKNPNMPSQAKVGRVVKEAQRTAQEAGVPSPATGQQVIQILQEAKEIAKEPTKNGARNIFNSAKSKLYEVLSKSKSLAKTRNGFDTAKAGARVARVLLIALAAGVAGARQNLSIKGAQASKTRQGAISTTKQKQKQKTETGTETIQKPKEVPAQITNQRIDTLTKQRQIQIITAIITGLSTAQAFRINGGKVAKGQTRLRGGVSKLRKYIWEKLQRKQRAYTPDVYSLIFGIKASPKTKIKLLNPNRTFTGIERRAIVR